MTAVLSLTGMWYRHGGGRSGFELSVPHLTIDRRTRLGILGPSGSGKSTLLDILAFILRPRGVEYWSIETVEGPEDVFHLHGAGNRRRLLEIRSRFLGYVLQTGGLLPFLTARANIELPRRLCGLRADGTVEHIASQLGIERHLAKMPSQLSVGERQRVAIARAAAHRPAILLADEPTAALDSENANNVMKMLVRLGDELDTALVVASHDWALLSRFGFAAMEYRSEPSADGEATRSVFRN